MKWKFNLITLSLVLFCLFAHSLHARPNLKKEHSPKPNILLIYVDDLGYEALNCYGGLDFSTPNLDQMAAEGIRFSRAYTSGVCTPSRVSMHTGLYSSRHHHNRVLPVHKGTSRIVNFEKMRTYAQLLRSNGYQTSVTGKWQLATLEKHPNHPNLSGFDSWNLWQIWKTDPVTNQGHKTTRYWNPVFNHNGKILKNIENRFGPDVLVEYVIQRMSDAKKENKPFLIVHNELLPHSPIVQTPDDLNSSPKSPPTLVNMVSYMDKLVKKLLDAVEDLKIKNNTYVFFMADNGTAAVFFDNPRKGQAGERKHTRHTAAGYVNGGKKTVMDAGTHVPLLVWGPDKIQKGSICNDLVDIVDIFPTFCELGSVQIPKNLLLDGHSIVPQIHGNPGKSHRYTYGTSDHKAAVFDGQWRLKKNGDFFDARKLPIETLIHKGDPEAIKARARLNGIMRSLESRK